MSDHHKHDHEEDVKGKKDHEECKEEEPDVAAQSEEPVDGGEPEPGH